jgi:hypothetical protein
VRGRALAEAWQDCETLLVGKSWLGGMKAKVHIRLFGVDRTHGFPMFKLLQNIWAGICTLCHVWLPIPCHIQ